MTKYAYVEMSKTCAHLKYLNVWSLSIGLLGLSDED